MAGKRTCKNTGKGLKQEIYNIGKLQRKLSRSYDRNKKTLKKKENSKDYDNFCGSFHLFVFFFFHKGIFKII